MSFSQFILDSHEQYRQQVRLRNSWVVRLRWWYLLILGGVAFVTSYTSTIETEQYRKFAVALILSGLALNFILWLILLMRRLSTTVYHQVAVIQILLDASLATAVVYFQGGIDSRATVLFAIPILSAGVLFVPIFAYTAAALSALLYTGGMVLYQHQNPGSYPLKDILLPAVFYSFVFFLLAIIVSGYTERNRAKERENSYAELLSLLRHQLHHPTGVIAAIVEMLEQGASFSKLTPKEKEYIRQLKYENHRIHAMITNLLKTADVDEKIMRSKDHWTDVHLINIITDCSSSVAVAYKRIKDLDLRLPNEDITMRGDPEQLQLAFENIVENAFKYSSKDHKVTISLLSKRIPTIEVDIQDHGDGISDKEQKKIFTAFNKLEASSKDSYEAINTYAMGLGLYISKMIIEQHGGEFSLQSKVGQGTKVIIKLKRDMWRYYYGQK
jgi:signal transduction histidine kinase